MESDSIFGDKANAIYQILDIPLKEYMRQRKAAKEDTYQFYKIISLREKQYIAGILQKKQEQLKEFQEKLERLKNHENEFFL